MELMFDRMGFKNNLYYIIHAVAVILTVVIGHKAYGQELRDSVALPEVEVTATRPKEEIIPAQRLDGKQLEKLNSNSVADALRYFSGVQVKDYGGVGGIKTVNIRSMGTNHTGVVYDGVALGNAQNGQIDLGQFSLDNIEAISLYNGQKSEILQPARDFGNAGSVYMRTRTPRFDGTKSYNAKGAVRFGSFDLLNPSALVELQLSPSVNASLSGEWISSSGKYKFRYRRVNPAGEIAYDTTAVRQNGDIEAMRLELNLNGSFDNGEWHLKGYHYNSERGIPGAIVNNVWRRGERQWDNNSFVQGSYRRMAGRFSTLFNAKYAFYRTHYVNNDERQVRVDNLYRQRELYLSTANQFRIMRMWHVSASYDFQWNSLETDMRDFLRPDRYTHLLSIATALNLPQLKFQASVLGTFIRDKVADSGDTKKQGQCTPAAYLSVMPLRGFKAFELRAFFKQSFRMPTFNDLYYADMGNSRLDPEKVTQWNVGALVDRSFRSGLLRGYRISADAYLNHVTDKIVAYPKGQQFRWTMLNLGKVRIKGIDVSAAVTVNPVSSLELTVRGQYTFQEAIDITNPADSYYRDQIPYIPRHSGSAVLNASWRGWGLNYSFIYVGERYNQQENILYNYTQPWYTSDVSVSKNLKVNNVNMRALVEVNNLLNQDYDVIANYPMPKRNFRVTLSVEM